MTNDARSAARPSSSGTAPAVERILSLAAWIIAICAVVFAVYLGWRFFRYDHSDGQGSLISDTTVETTDFGTQGVSNTPDPQFASVLLPEFVGAESMRYVPRRSVLHTVFPNRPRRDVLEYSVEAGDSVFEIAAKFSIKPETVLWGNYDQLNDNPDLIALDMRLLIPPVDGVLYNWQEGDTLEAIAARFEAGVQDILNWPGNNLDLVTPQVEAGTLIMVPGGHREFRQWLIPTIPRGSAGVAASVYGGGACQGSYEGAFGTGTFIWPTATHYLSGNDYWSGHLAIDIAAGDGAPVYAADSGVVVFAGWANGGYGNTVIIDHGNGYQSLYAHLNSVSVSCGRSILQGATVGFAGSTGNSTGTHLHFEVRYQGGFISPWYVLPAP